MSQHNVNTLEEAEYQPVGRILGVVDKGRINHQVKKPVSVVNPVNGLKKGGSFPLVTNYETLLMDARAQGLDLKCIGFVDEPAYTMIMVFQQPAGLFWEAFVGVNHRLERLIIEPRCSFHFGFGVFLSGKNQEGQSVFIVIPDGTVDSLGLVPTFNGLKVRRF
jgi:hypothetical protein